LNQARFGNRRRISPPVSAREGDCDDAREIAMNGMRIVGMAVLVVGVVILCMGVNASNSVADQMTHTFTGRFTHETAAYIFGGMAVALVGFFMIFGAGGKSA
jgi:hypothetical protein